MVKDIKASEIKDGKTVLEEGINSLLDSEKVITKIRAKFEDEQKLIPDEIILVMAVLDTESQKIRDLRESLQKLYRPYKQE